MDKLLLRVRDVVQLTSLSRSLVYQLIASQELKAVKVGRATRVIMTDLLCWIESKKAVDEVGVLPDTWENSPAARGAKLKNSHEAANAQHGYMERATRRGVTEDLHPDDEDMVCPLRSQLCTTVRKSREILNHIT